jgi:hypothetical protein
VEIDRFFIKENIDMRVLKLEYIKSYNQLADNFTKGLGFKENESVWDHLGGGGCWCK